MGKPSTRPDEAHARIGIHEFADCVVISLKGDHDLSTKPQLVAALSRLRRKPRTAIVIDLRQCTFVDSTIVGAILARPQDSSQEPTVSVVLPEDTSYVYRALSVLGLTELVPARLSIEAALGTTADGKLF
jgi:anti-anti-sigma factor